MKVCVVGAGAVGGLLGTRLGLAGGCTLSALARGRTLEALRANGWILRDAEGERRCAVRADDAPEALGVQDLVVIALKAPALPVVAPRLAPLLGLRTVVLPAMNGVPWWLVENLQSVDPGGVVAAAVPLERVLGCVVHASASAPEPGVVQHHKGASLIVGEPAGGLSERAEAVGRLLAGAGFELKVSERIRDDIWYKLWGNLTTNPISALTGATADRIVGDPLVSALCVAGMAEAKAIGERLGIVLPQTPAERHDVTRKLGAMKTSMLQDAEAGRPLELDAIVGAVRELGQRVGTPTPNIDAVFALARLFGRVRGLYPD